MTINVDELVARVVRYERDSILFKWNEAASAFHRATDFPAPSLGPDAESKATEIAEEIVGNRLLKALYGG